MDYCSERDRRADAFSILSVSLSGGYLTTFLFKHTCSKGLSQFWSCNDKKRNLRSLVNIYYIWLLSSLPANCRFQFSSREFSITSKSMFLPLPVVVGLFIKGSAKICWMGSITRYYSSSISFPLFCPFLSPNAASSIVHSVLEHS